MGIGNIPARKRGFGYDPVTRSLGVYVDGALAASFPPSPGRTYFVNNITGSSTNDGLSWGTAVDQVSAAITLSETYRELGGVESGSAVTTNDYVRNTIMVQGTGDYVGTEGGYDGLLDLGEHYNLIGLGTPNARGYGVGLVRIGKDTANTTGGMEDDDGVFEGVYAANIAWQSGDASPCFSCGILRKSTIEDCSFLTAPVVTGLPVAYFKLFLGGIAVVLRRCYTGSMSTFTNRAVRGIDLSAASHFAWSLIEDCQIGGITAGMHVGSSCADCPGTIVQNNFFGSMGHGVMATGIIDQSLRTDITTGLITYIGNYIQATDPVDLLNQWQRFIDNKTVPDEQTVTSVLYSGLH